MNHHGFHWKDCWFYRSLKCHVQGSIAPSKRCRFGLQLVRCGRKYTRAKRHGKKKREINKRKCKREIKLKWRCLTNQCTPRDFKSFNKFCKLWMSQDGVNKLESMCFIIFPSSKIISNCCFENILSLTIDKSADEISITIRVSEQKSYHFLPKSLEKFLMNRAAIGSKIKLSLCTKIISLIKS